MSDGSGEILRLCLDIRSLRNLIPHAELPHEELGDREHVEFLVVVQSVERVPQPHPAVEALLVLLEEGVVGVWKSNIVPARLIPKC